MISYIWDYILFGGLVIGTGVIGIYYGAVKRSKSISEYMTGDRNAVIPVLFSTIVTFTTPKQMIADPTAVIMFGTQTELGIAVGVIVGATIFINCFLPVHKTLRSRSLLEYFNLRHSKTVHTVAAIVMIFREVIVLPMFIYTPALVLKEMLGVPQVYTTTTMTIICLLYTCTGGLKAVIWTDCLQYVYFLVSVIVCIILGIYKLGGVSKVWQDGLNGERTEFINLGGQPLYDRANFLGGLTTGSIYALSLGVSQQTFFQRLYSLKDKSNTNGFVIGSYIGFFISRCNGLLTGLVVYSYFKDCDPLLTKQITKPDGIVPLFIRKMSDTVPGVLGLFLAGVVAAALSTISSNLNTTSCLLHDNIVVKLFAQRLSEKTSFIIMQSSIVVVGISALLVTPLFEQVESLQQLTFSMNGMTIGSSISLFSGMINPWVNDKGVIAGAVAGVLVPAWLFYNQIQLTAQGKLSYSSKLMTTSGCDLQQQFGGIVTNSTSSGYSGPGSRVYIDPSDPMAKFTAISYLWYSAISLVVSLIVSSIVSLCTGVEDVSKVNRSLVCPQIRWLLRKGAFREAGEPKDVTETVPLK